MGFLWLQISDEASRESDRAYIERNSIGLLTVNEVLVDPPSKKWLGSYSNKEIIRETGLWNISHSRRNYDPFFLEIFEQYVDATIGLAPPPVSSIAPRGWHKESSTSQLSFWED
jgi:hypothetical protein